LLLNGTVKWIDFRDSVFVTVKVNIRRDVTILLRSVGGVEVSDENIERYVDNPGVGILLALLRASQASLVCFTRKSDLNFP